MSLGPETVLDELGGYAKLIYDSKIVDQEQRLAPTYDALPVQQWNIAGAGWVGDAHLVRSSSFKFTTPTGALSQETTETNKQFQITSVEQVGNVAFTKDFLVKLTKGITSFGDFETKVRDLIVSGRKNQNQSCFIGPSNRRCLLTSSPSSSTTFTVDNTQYLFIGMYIDIYNASTLSVNNVKITNISGLTVTVGTAITATSGWQVYLHEEFLDGTSKGFNSLPFQSDDGTDFPATFENISRTTYPTWRGNRIDFDGRPLINDALQEMSNVMYTNGGLDYMAEDILNIVHPDTVRRYLKIIVAQKRYIDASKYDSGMEKPNMLEWNGRGILIDPDAPKRDWIMYNRNYGGKAELTPFEVESALGGTAMKWKNGYTQGVVLAYFNGQIGTSKSNANVIGKNFANL